MNKPNGFVAVQTISLPWPVRWPAWRSILPWSSLTVPALLLLVWSALSASGWISPQLLPSPLTVADAGIALWQDGELQGHLGVSLSRLAVGFGIGALGGLAFGAALAVSRNVEDYAGGLFHLFRHIPTIALIPPFILAFGVGETFKILIVVKGVFFPVAIAAHDAVRNIPRGYFEVARLYKLSRPAVIRHLLLPATLPSILTGLRIGLDRSWMLLVVAEQIAAENGIGQMMEMARQIFRIDIVMLGVVLTGVIGFALDRSVRQLETLTTRWKR
ncbi:ABC transporter permease [Jeongeupia chitinilytica]|uniref:ABC transporter permease n=1 Tax=Jeongeupia chitinilytica TaxID=1041641 RepID=A0ABQ3H0A5_9NEIS|nr:ABC transporter permease [Jeongeupia chitinilytica]GHD63954.1 ABC transporter permease [Jeongeupia chitinilytica]